MLPVFAIVIAGGKMRHSLLHGATRLDGGPWEPRRFWKRRITSPRERICSGPTRRREQEQRGAERSGAEGVAGSQRSQFERPRRGKSLDCGWERTRLTSGNLKDLPCQTCGRRATVLQRRAARQGKREAVEAAVWTATVLHECVGLRFSLTCGIANDELVRLENTLNSRGEHACPSMPAARA